MTNISTWIPNKSFTKKVIFILLPVIIGSMLDNAVYFLDNFMATPLGDEGLAAVSAANEILFIMSMFVIGITFMSDIIMAQIFGSKNREKLHEALRIKFYFISIVAIIIFLPLFFTPSTFINIFTIGKQANNNFNSLSSEYLKLMSIGQLIWMIGFIFLSTLTTIGKTKWTLYISLTSLLINFIFNYIFINVIDMGIKGLAYSTIISRIVEIFILAFAIYKTRYWLWPFVQSFRISKKLVKLIFSKWLVMIGHLIWVLGLVAQTIVWSNYYGPEILSGIGIAYAIAGIAFTAFPAVGTAVRVIVGHELGAGNIETAKEKSKMLFPIIMSLTIILISIMITISWAVPWKTLIAGETDAPRIIRAIGLTFAIAMPFFMITAFSFAHLEVGGFVTMSTIFDRLIQLGLMVPVAIILSIYTNLDIVWVFALIHVINALPAFLAFPIYLRGKWARKIVTKQAIEI